MAIRSMTQKACRFELQLAYLGVTLFALAVLLSHINNYIKYEDSTISSVGSSSAVN